MTYELLTILAILLSPFIALFAQRQIEEWKERKSRKLLVFKTLMANRSNLTPDHVQALNMIDLEFTDRNEAEIRKRWKEYFDHLEGLWRLPEVERERRIGEWSERREDLLAELLAAMGTRLGYSFDKVYLKRSKYAPHGFAEQEVQFQTIRRLLIEILSGERSINTATSLLPSTPESGDLGERMLRALVEVLEGDRALSYKLKQEPASTLRQPADDAI